MTATYDVGDLVVVSVTFAVDGTPTDPTTVTCRIKAPDGTVKVLVYGTDAGLIRDSAGVYHVDVNITMRGTYRYRWEGTGDAQAAEETKFHVRTSQF